MRGGADEDVFLGNGLLTSPEEELHRLRRENATLRQERDFLKKAAAYFAQESP
jgi:transposase